MNYPLDGWNEIKMLDLDDELIVSPPEGHRVIVKRIRGTTAGAFTLADKLGSGAITDIPNAPVLAAGNHDVPGLRVMTRVGADLYAVDGSASDGPLWIQYAFKREIDQASWDN